MDWTQVWTILGTTAALFVLSIGTTLTLFIWNRTESRADCRLMLGMIQVIQNEMKDFHGKLCAIEERNRK